MKTIKHWAVLTCWLSIPAFFAVSCGKQTINGAALPEFYGLFAVDGGKLIQIKQGGLPSFSENVTFLVFDKNVAATENATFYSIGFDTEPHPADDGSFSWQKFAQAGEAYQRATQAAMSGIPEGAVPIETLKKPVPNKNEMLQFVPATPLKPGVYQFGNAVKFWVNKEKYQTTVESNARQQLQTGHWVDASRFATIALIVGTSSPKVLDEMTQIKYGAVSKGANEALKQGNFDLAENLAKRGSELQPPSPFASEFSQLLKIEIPYQKAMKAATAAAQQEDWDLLTRACGFALNIKPNDSEAMKLLSKSPKILLSGCHGIRLDQYSEPITPEILYLKFNSDGRKLFAAVARNKTDFRYDLIWNVAGKQFLAPVENPVNAMSLDFSGDIVAINAFNRPLELKDIETGSGSSLPLGGIDQFGLSQDGSILWTGGSLWQRGDLSKYGLLSAAEAIGLAQKADMFGNISGIMFWNSKTLTPFTMVGFPDNQEIQNILIPSDNKVAVICEVGYRGPSAESREKYPDRLSVWDIAMQKLLAKFNSQPENMLVLCAVRPDETSAVIYDGKLQIGDFGAFQTAEKGPEDTLIIHSKPGKFKFFNWSSCKVTQEVNVPPEVSLVAFNQNSKYIAYASQSDSVIRIAELDTWKIVHSFKEASGVKVTHLAFNPDGAYLAVAVDRDKDLLALWKIPDDLKPLIAEKSISSSIQRGFQHLEDEVRKNPTNFQAAFDLAGACLQLQQTDRAVQVLEGVLNHPQAEASALRGLLQAYSSFGNTAGLQKTVEKFEALARANPANYQAALGLAEGYRQVKKNEAALQTVDQVFNNPKADANAVLGAATVYAALGNVPRLEAALERLTKVMPGSPEAWYDLAALKSNIGKPGEALAALRQALELSAKRLQLNPKAQDLLANARKEERFTPLRQLPEFQKLVQHYSSVVANPPENNSPGSNSAPMPAALQATLAKAQAGDAQAQLDLGMAYATGKGVDTNYVEATKWFRKAAEQNHALAQNNLGVSYNNGRGVAKDEVEAVKWFRKADEQNLASAQDNLGLMYQEGRGVAKDEAEALRWYRKAAEQNSADAQNDLAWLLATSENSAVRDGPNAVVFAEKAVAATNRKNPWNLGTLAAAYAEVGQFEKAVSTQQEAIALLQTEADKNNYRTRLKLFQARVPYHQTKD
jgi:TPR repeat protein/WD40 repeat protein